MVTQRRQHVQQILVIVALAAAGLLPVASAGAWPGDPDGTYGACGTMAFDILPGTPSAARAVALQADGKAVVAGYSNDRGLVMRRSAGQYDAAFATMGRARIAHPGVTCYFAVAPTASGGVGAAGTATNGATIDFVVVRLTPAGALDTTFNTTGKLAFEAGGPDGARSVVSTVRPTCGVFSTMARWTRRSRRTTTRSVSPMLRRRSPCKPTDAS